MKLAVSNVSFSYPSGVLALVNVSLDVASGTSMALIGENGAGKTTLAKHLNGLLVPGEGSVAVGDWDTRAHSVARLASRVGYVFQNPDDQLFARTLWDDVAFGPRNLGRDDEEVSEAVAAALERVGLVDMRETNPHDLPVSARRLASIAAVLAMNTPIIVLDEPTTGQDAAGVALLGEIVQELQAEERTVLAITHDMQFCAAYFQRIVVMADGAILADGPADRILADADMLRKAGVRPPQLVRLALALNMDEIPLDIDGFVAAYRRRVPSSGEETT